MYCRNCGAQIPDGAAFCPKCGTALRSAPQSDPRGPNAGYQDQPPQQPYAGQPAATQSVDGVKINTWPLVMDILFGIQILLMLILAANPFSAIAIGMIDTVVSIALLVVIILDLVYLSNIGIRGGWKWSILIMPLYLFLRAAKTDHDNKWAIINLIEYVVSIIISMTLSASLLALIAYAM